MASVGERLPEAAPTGSAEHLTALRALHRQNAGLDYDIASVLSEHACEPLDEEIERLSALLATCVRTRARIVDSAWVLFNRHGFESVSIDDVMKNAG